MTSLSSDSCFSGGNLCRRFDITDDDDDMVGHVVPAEAVLSLRPFVVALARRSPRSTSTHNKSGAACSWSGLSIGLDAREDK